MSRLWLCGAALALLGTLATGPHALGDDADTVSAVGPDDARAAQALIAEHLRSPGARTTGLRWGRAGAICGLVEVTNRMGQDTGPRPFVADLRAPFAGRVPEGPELRHPASAAAYRAMEQTRMIFRQNCIAE